MMDFRKIFGTAKTVDEAKKFAVDLAHQWYGVEEEDLIIEVKQKPSNFLFAKRDAIVSVEVKNNVKERLTIKQEEEARIGEEKQKREEEQKRQEAEQKRIEEERKQREEELRQKLLLEQKEKEEKEQREQLYCKIKEKYLRYCACAISLPRYIQKQLLFFSSVFSKSPYMVNVSTNSMIEDWMKVEAMYDKEGFFDLETRTKILPELSNLYLSKFDYSALTEPRQYESEYMINFQINNEKNLILHPLSDKIICEKKGEYYEGCDFYFALIEQEFDIKKKYIYETSNRDSASFYLQFGRLYIQFLMHAVSLSFFFECIDEIKKNEEFYTIVENAIGERIGRDVIDKLYSIYQNYYIETFFRVITRDEFEAVLRCFSQGMNRRNSIGYVNEYLANKGINMQVITDEIKAYCEAGSVYDNLKKQIEKGRFDSFIGCGEEAINILFDGINYQILDNWPVDVWTQMIFEVTDARKYFETYNEKYVLLHPEINKQSTILSIKDDYQNVITGVDFENVLKRLYESYGYKVSTTKTTGDQGADLILKKGNKKTVVQAKYYSSAVGNSAVQEVTAAIAYYKANNGIVVTNSTFTSSAISLAEANEIELIDGDKLQKLIDGIIQ